MDKSKSYKVFRVKRKVIEEELEDLESETEFNFFHLEAPHLSRTPSYDDNGDIVPYEIVGPLSAFTSKGHVQRASVKKLFDRCNSKKFPTLVRVDYEAKFKETLENIEKASKNAKAEEIRNVKLLSPREKILENREKQILQKYQKVKSDWKGIEKGLAGKSNKKVSELLATHFLETGKSSSSMSLTKISSKSDIQDTLKWYMSLREDANDKKRETYLQIGSELNGLYTRIKFNTEDQMLPNSSEDFSELQVVGISKLPLEISAVKRLGCEYLNSNLLPNEKTEEVLIEHYDAKYKARNI